MNLIENLRTWWQVQTGEDETPFDGDSSAFLASMLFHLVLLIVMGFCYIENPEPAVSLVIDTPVIDDDEEELVQVIEDYAFSESIQEQELGSNSALGQEMALSMAQEISESSEIPSPLEDLEVDPTGKIELNNEITMATGMNYSENLVVRGAAGEGVTGSSGAADRLTHEIMLSLEERKTLVVWLFDQSGSLNRQRASIVERFDRIYRELGVLRDSGNVNFSKHDDKPLLTSIVSFGQQISLLNEQPTDDVDKLKELVAGIKMDTSGEERVFEAINMSIERFKRYRLRNHITNQPDRNVMLIVLTDEAGDDYGKWMETTIKTARRYAVPVHVVGVPAPFGREETLVKWVDPDPQYDQTPQWGRVSQGPESLMPERIQLSIGGTRDDKNPIDSGFGPFALTRLCYETGGIYFTVHPNRNVNRTVTRGETAEYSAHLSQFFDPQVMRRYRPDYVSAEEYIKRVSSNGARAALVTAARKSWMSSLKDPQLRFVKRSEAEMKTELDEAQKQGAALEPMLREMHELLKRGERDRVKETAPRWKAGFDLAIGRVMAVKSRTETYNAMLAEAKGRLKFKDPKNNTWVLKPSTEVSVGSKYAKDAAKANEYLQRVIDEHPGTPWAYLAKRELETPIGWAWSEEFTDLTPRPQGGGGNNNNNAAADDKKKMLKRGPEKRKIPKL